MFYFIPMLIIRTNQPNTMVVTVSQNSELTNPEYLFSFVHIFSKERVSFIPTDISTHKSRYDEFYFVEGTGVGEINFPYAGLYLYGIWEQPAGSGNLDPALATNVVENGEAQIIVSTAITTDSQFDIFVSNNEDNSNIIFAPDEPNPTPNITPSPTSTPGLASPTPTPSVTPTLTPTNTPSVTPTNTPSATPSITPTNTPTPSSTPPSYTGLTFIVGTGATSVDACTNLTNGITSTIYAQDLGNCAPCLPFNCWPCLSTTQQLFYDQAYTLPVADGYYANYYGTPPGNKARWYVIGGYPQPAGFVGC